MRNILFKAKRVDNGEWVEGYLFDNGFFESRRMFVGGFVIEEHKGTADDDWDVTGTDFYEVETSTICQYTGLTDKNGNKIFERDIVKCYADTDDVGNDLYFFYKVIWHEVYHCWWLSDIHTTEDEYLHQYNSSDIEVIGNVFDNPELLEVKQ